MSKYVRFATDRAVVATRVLDGTGPSAVDATLLTAPLFHRRGTEALCRKTNSWGDFHAWREFLNRAKDHVLGCRPDLTGSQAQRLVKRVMIAFSTTWTREVEIGTPGRSEVSKNIVQAQARTHKRMRKCSYKEAVGYEVVKYVRNKCTAWLNASYESAILKMTAVLRSSIRVMKAINKGVRTRSGGGNRRGHAPVWWNQVHPNTPWSPDAEGILSYT